MHLPTLYLALLTSTVLSIAIPNPQAAAPACTLASSTASASAAAPTAAVLPNKPKVVKSTYGKIQGAQNRNCNKWIEVEKGDTCATVGASVAVSEEEIRKLNAFLEKDEKCVNLWAGYDLCVGIAASASASAT